MPLHALLLIFYLSPCGFVHFNLHYELPQSVNVSITSRKRGSRFGALYVFREARARKLKLCF